MGGHNAGEVASKIAIETLEEEFTKRYNKKLSIEEIKELLREIYNKAHEKIKENAIEDKEGMGTTLTTAIIKGDKCIVGNCGDSRAYLIRNGKIIFKTKDHTLVQTLVDEGHITEEEAFYHPMKNILNYALGIDDIKVDIYELNLKKGDIILLSSDGLHDYLKESEILKIVNEYSSPELIAKELLNYSLNISKDNISIIVYKH